MLCSARERAIGADTGNPGGVESTYRMQVKAGFKVERVYEVPRDQEGSWVSMAVDDKGRLIVSSQYGGIFRVSLPFDNAEGSVNVEPIDLPIGQAQGLLYAFDALYVVVNGDANEGSGLYRLTDSDGDDSFDRLELLKRFGERVGEHGPHAVLLSPDRKSLYVVSGNLTPMPEGYEVSRVPEAWGEDLLLPRVRGRGFMSDALAPRGWIAKTDPDGKRWEIVATGLRNAYDAAFDLRGELFTYDADMERDFNTPWYRPTRVCHVVSGAEFGWRNDSGKWPSYYPDSVPPIVEIGPGSPTGVTFGYGAAFPERYQKALFVCDWSYGKLYAVHLTPRGARYQASLEEFITGQPLALTDIVVNPRDRAMYFLVGGRKVQSVLYRLTYMGEEAIPTERLVQGNSEPDFRLLKSLESYHGKVDSDAVDFAWPHLSHPDRTIRYAARTAIEHQPVESWQDRVFSVKDPVAAIEAAVALARLGEGTNQNRLLSYLHGLD